MRNDISVDVISVECEGEESYQCGIEPTPFIWRCPSDNLFGPKVRLNLANVLQCK